MDIFNLLTLFGGLAFFLYGMQTLSGSLRKLAGGRLEQALKKVTANPLAALGLGAGVTIAIQSSSAMSVMLVGLVNSGILQAEQTISILFGSHIGTTCTAWLLSLSGLSGENVLLRLLQPSGFAPVLAFVGVMMIMLSKKERRRDIGTILGGFAILLFGMELMKDSVAPLAELPEFREVLTAFSNPLLGILVGAVFTGIIQSSAASVGILQALSLTGGVSFGAAIPIVMGQNIGTCVTGLISSIGVTRNARRVAVINVSISLIGTVICTALLYGLDAAFDFAFLEETVGPVGIAACHTAFNVLVTAILMPFPRLFTRIAALLVPERAADASPAFLDERLLATPAFALSECESRGAAMCELAHSALERALAIYAEWDPKELAAVAEAEEGLDHYEDLLGSFLVRLSGQPLLPAASRTVGELLHCIGDFERIGDHALNLAETAQEIAEKRITFPEETSTELARLRAAVSEITDLTRRAFLARDCALAARVEPLEQVIDGLITAARSRHINLLQSGESTITLGFVLSDLLTNCERISDHCSNIAVAVIEAELGGIDPHTYLRRIKTGEDPDFRRYFTEYAEKYGM